MIVRGIREKHENVAMTVYEPGMVSKFLAKALKKRRADDKVLLFDDGMLLTVHRDPGDGRWSITVRPEPVPPADASWKTFPLFTFAVSGQAIERAIAELRDLAAVVEPDDDSE